MTSAAVLPDARVLLTRIVVAHNRLKRSEITAKEFDDYALGLLTPPATEPPADVEGMREALGKAHLFAVLTLAFLGRDRVTDRQEQMLDDLQREAASIEATLRAALTASEQPAKEGQS